MKNLTLAVDEAALKGARIYAAERDTTVNALVRDYLNRLADHRRGNADLEAQRAKARQELVEMSKRSTGQLGPDWKWNRAELYDRDALRRLERTDLRGDGTPISGSETKKGE